MGFNSAFKGLKGTRFESTDEVKAKATEIGKGSILRLTTVEDSHGVV